MNRTMLMLLLRYREELERLTGLPPNMLKWRGLAMKFGVRRIQKPTAPPPAGEAIP